MSLYDSIAKTLSAQGLTNAIRTGTDSALSGIAGITGDSAFGKALSNIGTGMARNAAVGLVNKYVPGNMQRLVNSGTGTIGDILQGNFSDAGIRLLDSGLLYDFIPGIAGVGAQARFYNTPTPLFGGISPAEAKQIYQEIHSTQYCKKNLWLIEVSSAIAGDISQRFNLFATELEYSPMTVTGEKHKVGAAHVDGVNSADPTELRITTYDDTLGTIKSWFKLHAENTANSDGTVWLPGFYAIKIKIVHGFITQGSNRGGYEDVGLFRAGSIDMNLSRREDGLEELQMSFVQLDTFIPTNSISA